MMTRFRRPMLAIASACAVAFPISSAWGVTAQVPFNATITPTCTLTVNNGGTMTPSANLQALSSKNAGGSAGSVALSTTGGVGVSLDPVTIDSVPASDTSSTTWVQTYAASGAHTVAETSGSTSLTGPGSSTLTVHLEGTKGGSDVFSTGNYSATVTVRCE